MYKILICVIIITGLNFSNLFAKIVYLDVQYVIDNSEIGKFYKDKLKAKTDKDKLNLIVQEKKIKNADQLIQNQKNILKENEIKKKVEELNKLVLKYTNERKKYNDDVSQQKKDYTLKILDVLNPLITNYVKNNNINLVLEKKNVLIGIKDLDISKNILLKLNEYTKQNNLINEN
tara:strand:+ start:996 stop:1520 length:525 start_codon:yes stop_codon:yes gene_type:complete